MASNRNLVGSGVRNGSGCGGDGPGSSSSSSPPSLPDIPTLEGQLKTCQMVARLLDYYCQRIDISIGFNEEEVSKDARLRNCIEEKEQTETELKALEKKPTTSGSMLTNIRNCIKEKAQTESTYKKLKRSELQTWRTGQELEKMVAEWKYKKDQRNIHLLEAVEEFNQTVEEYKDLHEAAVEETQVLAERILEAKLSRERDSFSEGTSGSNEIAALEDKKEQMDICLLEAEEEFNQIMEDYRNLREATVEQTQVREAKLSRQNNSFSEGTSGTNEVNHDLLRPSSSFT